MRVLSILIAILLIVPTAWANQSEDARELFERAQELIQRDRYSRAERLLEELIESHDDDELLAEAMYWRAFAFYRLGEEDESRRDYETSLKLLEQSMHRFDNERNAEEVRELMGRVEGRLARLGDRDASRRVRERAEDEGDEMRMAALEALIHMDSDRALPIVMKILRNPDEYPDEMRERAVFLISQHAHDDEAADLLMEIARREDEDEEIRGQAIFWLSQVDDDRTLQILIEVLEDDSLDEELQGQAIFAISQIDDRRSAEALRDVALNESYDDELRANAIFWLGQQSDAEFDFLRDMYDTVDSHELKDKIIFAASQQGGREQMEFLQTIVNNPEEDTELRTQALFWLGQSGMLDIEGLVDVYESMDDEEMRGQAIFAISQHGGREAADALIRIVRSEDDAELKQNALFWLGQMDDDRAADILEEIIEGGGR